MILCLGTTPAAQRVMTFGRLELDLVNRARMALDGIAGKSINVAKVLATLGADPIATGFIGGTRGDDLLKELTERGIKSDFVSVPVQTRQCITVLDETSRTVTELVEESRAVAVEHYQALQAVVEKHLPNCLAIVMSGSLTPGAPLDFYKEITGRANRLNVLSIVDAQGAALLQALEAAPGLVKPNRKELESTVGRELGNEWEITLAMKEVHERGAVRVVVTAGTSPTLLLDGQKLWRVHTPRVDAINPIGSGDAFTAALVWRLVQQDSLGEACRWASAAGAANALTAMPGDLQRDDVERLVKQVQIEQL